MRFFQLREFSIPGVDFLGNIVTGTKKPEKQTSPALKPAFTAKLRQVADALGVEADHLMKIMRFETMGTMNPGTYKGSNAVGLIQFLPVAAKAMGTTPQQLASMSDVEQLDYVYKFYKMNKLPPGSSLSDIYLYTYMPAALQTGQKDDFVLGMKGAYGKKIWDVDLGQNWDSNPAFAREAKKHNRTYFTVGDVRNVINRA